MPRQLNCKHCGMDFASHIGTRYCSLRCRQDYHATVRSAKAAEKTALATREVQIVCAHCLDEFSYKQKPGRYHKKYCSDQCGQAAWKLKIEASRARFKCSCDGCGNQVFNQRTMLCQKHYSRQIRNGNTASKTERALMLTQAGYKLIKNPSHPLAMTSGNVAEHRAVAYETHAGVCPECFWCNRPLAWGSASIDHLNEDKRDNDPGNLVVSCNRCNRARGAMLPFIETMRPAAHALFLTLVSQRLGMLADRPVVEQGQPA